MSFCQMFGCLLLGRRRVDSHVWVSPWCGALIAPYARFSSAGVLRQRDRLRNEPSVAKYCLPCLFELSVSRSPASCPTPRCHFQLSLVFARIRFSCIASYTVVSPQAFILLGSSLGFGLVSILYLLPYVSGTL